MTNEQKLIAVVALLPVMADLMEDVKIYNQSKKYGNRFSAWRGWGLRSTIAQIITNV
jgi:hypothetical protein